MAVHSTQRQSSKPQPTITFARIVAALTGIASAILCGLLIMNYPINPAVAFVAAAAVGGFAWVFPKASLVVVATSLPALGLATWTGWTVFEEFDLLILSIAAGIYLRIAWRLKNGVPTTSGGEHQQNLTVVPCVLLVTFAAFAAS